MTKYIQGKDGKFAGSIGDGKGKTPTDIAAPGVPAPASHVLDDAPAGDLDALYARLAKPSEENTDAEVAAIYAEIEADSLAYLDYHEDSDEYQPLYELSYSPDVDARDLTGSQVALDHHSGKYIAQIGWQTPKPEWDMPVAANSYKPTVDYHLGEISSHDTEAEAIEALKQDMARRVPAERNFVSHLAASANRTARDRAVFNGFSVSEKPIRRGMNGEMVATLHSSSVNGSVMPRDGHISMRHDGTYFAVVRYSGNDLNKTTNPSSPFSKAFASPEEAFAWVEGHLGQEPEVL